MQLLSMNLRCHCHYDGTCSCWFWWFHWSAIKKNTSAPPPSLSRSSPYETWLLELIVTAHRLLCLDSELSVHINWSYWSVTDVVKKTLCDDNHLLDSEMYITVIFVVRLLFLSQLCTRQLIYHDLLTALSTGCQSDSAWSLYSACWTGVQLSEVCHPVVRLPVTQYPGHRYLRSAVHRDLVVPAARKVRYGPRSFSVTRLFMNLCRYCYAAAMFHPRHIMSWKLNCSTEPTTTTLVTVEQL